VHKMPEKNGLHKSRLKSKYGGKENTITGLPC